MNREDIIRMANEAGIIHPEMVYQTLERFAALVASAEREASVGALSALNNTYELELRNAIANEREACAKWLEDVVDAPNWAEAIRARGQV